MDSLHLPLGRMCKAGEVGTYDCCVGVTVAAMVTVVTSGYNGYSCYSGYNGYSGCKP